MKLIEKDFDELIDQNLQFQKEIQTLKTKKNKTSENSGEKSCQIKMLVDEYYKELELNLLKL